MRFKLALVAVGVFAASIAVAGLPRVAAGRPRADPADAVGRLDLHKAEVNQVRRSIRLKVQTRGGFRLSALDRHPDTTDPAERFICLQIHHYGHTFTRQLCFGSGPKGSADTLGYALLKPDGSVRSWEGIDARVDRPSKRSVTARFKPGRADLAPGNYRWRFVSQSTGAECQGPGEGSLCFDRLPNGHDAVFSCVACSPWAARIRADPPASTAPAATSGSR